jgi:transcriptional regulator GlxA family with amidase domain
MLSHIASLTNQMRPPPGMFVAVSGDASGKGDVRVSARGGLSPHTFRRVRDYVRAHLADNVSNSVLAELACLSACHFVRAFKQSAAVTPHRFVMQSRIERVKHLLVDTNLPLTQISAITGFADQSHLTRQFRALVGTTPKRFRRALRQAKVPDRTRLPILKNLVVP